MEIKTIAIASDHAGFAYKKFIIEELEKKSYKVKDFGPHNSDSMDYPDTISLAAKAVSSGEYDQGIVLCGTGIGASITANKIDGIRAALCHNDFTARMSRLHNNANIIAFGARLLAKEYIMEMISIWLTEDYEGGRHQTRLDKLHALEK